MALWCEHIKFIDNISNTCMYVYVYGCMGGVCVRMGVCMYICTCIYYMFCTYGVFCYVMGGTAVSVYSFVFYVLLSMIFLQCNLLLTSSDPRFQKCVFFLRYSLI